MKKLILVVAFLTPFAINISRSDAVSFKPGGGFNSEANGVSADGSAVVGNSSEAFSWTSGGGVVGLGDMLRGVSFAIRSSAGGSVAVGWSNSFSGLEAFSRTSEGRSRTQTEKESNL